MSRLLETGDYRLLETGDFRLMEGIVNFDLLAYTPPLGSAINFELSEEVTPPPFFMGFGMSKKLGRPEWDDPLNVYGIYQMRMMDPNREPGRKSYKKSKRPLKMKFYTPTNPQTVAQQANRQKFADAMSAWGSLTDEQKNAYNKRARKLNLFGWNIFIREYYQAN